MIYTNPPVVLQPIGVNVVRFIHPLNFIGSDIIIIHDECEVFFSTFEEHVDVILTETECETHFYWYVSGVDIVLVRELCEVQIILSPDDEILIEDLCEVTIPVSVFNGVDEILFECWIDLIERSSQGYMKIGDPAVKWYS